MSVVIYVHNAENRISSFLKTMIEVLEENFAYSEIICVNDASSDKSDECIKKISYIKEPRCKKCGKPIRYKEQECCLDCQRKNFSYQQGRSLWVHKGVVPWSIYQFKYHNRRIYGEFYAQELYHLYGEKIRQWGIDVIVPVPLHPKKRRMRGYNQTEIIAKHLSKMTGIPMEKNWIYRVRYTEPQKKLNNKERKKNLEHAFAIKKISKEYQNVLLIDDIYTTGSTIDTIAKQLLEKCNKKTWFLTISIGQDF